MPRVTTVLSHRASLIQVAEALAGLLKVALADKRVSAPWPLLLRDASKLRLCIQCATRKLTDVTASGS